MAAEAEEAARSQLATVTIQEACPQCGEEIDEDEGDGDAAETLVRAEGRTFHKSCFVCAECLVSLVGRPFIGHEGRNYCERDYASLFAPRCGACGEPILGRCVTALELPWHPDCCACKMCGKALTSGYVKRKGMALCAACNREEQEAHLRAGSCGPEVRAVPGADRGRDGHPHARQAGGWRGAGARVRASCSAARDHGMAARVCSSCTRTTSSAPRAATCWTDGHRIRGQALLPAVRKLDSKARARARRSGKRPGTC